MACHQIVAKPLSKLMMTKSQFGHPGINLNEILINMVIFPFKNMHLKMLSAEWLPFCLSASMG